MEFKLLEIENKETWEGFFSLVEEKTFLQSWNWGNFNKLTGKEIIRFGVYSGKNLVATTLVIVTKARRGSFLFLPHGPNLKKTDINLKADVLRFLLGSLKNIAKKYNCVSIKIAPLWNRNENNSVIFKRLGFREAPIHVHPDITWELDLSLGEEELLSNMRKTTRYLIRRANREKQIEIIQSKEIKSLDEFNKLYQLTKNRQEFTPFSLDYLKGEFDSFIKDNQIIILLAKYKGEVLASGVFLFWQGIGFYHHGSSSQKYPKIPASYFLIWKAIEEAKRRGCKKFNFWGTAPLSDSGDYNKKHPWAGLTLFKMGFGGYVKKYVKTQDFILSYRYWLSYLIEKIRKIKRGL